MDVLQSRLAKRHSQLAQEIKELLTKAQELGAQDGVLRMELVCDQYDDVLPDIAYNWINLNAFQSEIEEAFYKARPNELVSFGRNVVAILPLIVTWFAVFEATNTYQQDIALHPQDRSIPFLQLWQNGFHGTTWFTFSVSAGIIFMLLLILVVLLFLGQTLNRSAKSSATKLVGSLRVAAGKLIEAIVADSRIMPYR
ncbi:MAG TPA: hypothetical protein VFV38_26980, partial [Ktedonobacteraceae bacterium]|nr:hypothetical protein [Ktedonobacteraceae bacterium]